MQYDDWFLSARERGNPSNYLDARHAAGSAWSLGSSVSPLIHGSTYFTALCESIRGLNSGDVLLFSDWRGDPDEHISMDSTVSETLCEAAARGVVVNGLVWRSHSDRLAFSATENRHLGAEVERAGGRCLLDMRVRLGGSHHQKFVVARGLSETADDVAFVGGIDLCHSRLDDGKHLGDPQRQAMAAVYGPRPPWHDVHLALRGPVVGDVETVFRERWQDPQPLSRAPWRRISDRLRDGDDRARTLPAQRPDPPACGTHAVQLLRTYPARHGGYPFAPHGERSVARGYAKALQRARTLVYVEDQYLWSLSVCRIFAAALSHNPSLRFIAIVPRFPDQDGSSILTGQ